ncbi:hypothetical protein GYB61_00530 [bacterium]|nr:hypothetical protein [bacterium]
MQPTRASLREQLATRGRLRGLRLAVAVVVMLATVGLAVLGVTLWQQMADTRERWDAFHAEYTSYGTQLGALYRTLGYGGFIHDFKNYVLRGQPALRKRVARDLDEAEALLAQLRTHDDLSAADDSALEDIGQMLAAYRAALDLATTLHAQRIAPVDIDAAVRVDDSMAKQALTELDSRYRAREDDFAAKFAARLVDNARLMSAALPVILLLVLLGGLMVWLIRSLLKVLTGLEQQIAARSAAEAQLRSNSEALERTNAELQQFAYVASHDLRAPLRGVETLAGWIEEDAGDALSDEGKTHMTMLRARIGRLDHLLQDLLAYSRSGRDMAANAQPTDTREVIDEELELMNAPASVTIIVSGDWPTLELSRAPFAQVLRNLVSNAIKHGDAAGMQITVTATPDEHGCSFAVEDNGPGIPEEFHERVFGMFQTLKPRDQVEGSGMGLAMVKKIVTAAGGKITLTSPITTDADGQPRGCCFTIDWPSSPHAAAQTVAPTGVE